MGESELPEITEERVANVAETLELIQELREYADENPDSPVDAARIGLLDGQLDALYQSLQVVAVQKGDDSGS